MPMRIAGFAFAALLQAGFVWALVSGLQMQDITKIIVDPLKVILDQKPIKPPEQPVTVKTVEPHQLVVPVPPIDIAPDRGPDVITGTPLTPGIHPVAPGDRGPVSVAATHTIPPYPPLDIRLGNQGTVLLRLLVGADGRVLDAQILRSSGAPGLDRAAQAWVIAHWRYQPAIHGGAAVQGAVDVAVKFDLKNAG
jgi:protein TonB